jgi:hypothetical protein
MTLLLAHVAVEEAHEELGDEVVTLSTWGQRPLLPEGIAGTGPGDRCGVEAKRALGHH